MRKIILRLGFLLLFSQPIRAQQIEFLTPKLIHLGGVKEGSVVTECIRFVNTGDAPVHIREVRTSCGCTVAEVDKKEIMPGDTATVSFSLNTARYSSTIRKPLTILFKEEDLPDAKFIIQADINSELNITPRFIHIKNIKVNPDTVMTYVLTVRNNSEKPIRLKKIHADYEFIQVHPTSAIVPSGDEHSIRLKYTPLQSGSKTAYVKIETDYDPKRKIQIPIFIQFKD